MNTNIKPVLWAVLVGIVMVLWLKWQAANTPILAVADTQGQQAPEGGPALANVNVPANISGQATERATGNARLSTSGKVLTVTTDVFKISIDTVGGTIVASQLLRYPAAINDKTPIQLFSREPGQRFVLQSALYSNQAQNATPQAVFTAVQNSYELSGDKVSVPLIWQQDGVTVTKTFTFYKGRYDFAIEQRVDNRSGKEWKGYAYYQMLQDEVKIARGLSTFHTFAGLAYSTPEHNYEKKSFAKLADSKLNIEQVKGGWMAMTKHYFMGAIIPEQSDKNTFYSKTPVNGLFAVGMYGQTRSIANGQSLDFKINGFVGPKIKDDLQRIAPNLDKAIDYGYLFFISEVLFNVLAWVDHLLGNWGWAIVVVTLAIKLALFPLAAKGFKSMAKMRKFQPEMERLRENYKDDRQMLGKKTMELYKKEGINPASGCLPILIQIPIFLAFYYMLMESVELRQAPWILWIRDLSLHDPFYILPLLNMGLMFVQQLLSPPPSDPIQRRIMRFLPLVFGFMFLFFPAGLVLYWTVSNGFSIAQQYFVTKRYGALHVPVAKS